MQNQACVLKHVFRSIRLHQYTYRSFVSRSPLKDEGTKKVMDDIRKLEQKLETAKKMEKVPFGKLDEQDIAAIYKDLSTMPKAELRQQQPKISPDYLEKLRVKFLDTRRLLQQQQQQQQLTSPELQSTISNTLEDCTTMATDMTSSKTTCQQDEGLQETTVMAITDDKKSTKSLEDISIYDFEQLIYANALARRPKQAEEAIQLMKDCNFIPSLRCYNHLMDAYANVDDVDQVVSVFKRLGDAGLSPDVYSYSSLVKVLVQASRLDDAFIVFDQMKRLNTIPSQPIFSNLINGCLKSRQINKAWKTFDEMRLSYHQPDEVTFTMMLHACAKDGQVEKALNLFEEMSGLQLYPTDVTFNVLIHACAKRPDYYDEAFSLLQQMEEIHGFQPDLITYNTLLGACARKKDLGRAREIFRHILQHDQLEPDHRTFTNLFWSYANYDPPSSSSVPSTSSSSSSSSSALVPNTIDQLVPNSAPTRRSEVVDEAKKIFSYMTQQEDPAIEMTTTLLTAYLNTHVTQRQVKDCVSLYDSLFSKYNVEPNPTTFKVMIRHCYQTKDTALAWRIWDDYQAFLETKASQAYEHTSDMTMMEQKKMKLERHQQQIKEGWTLDQQRSLVLLMASVLARANELDYAVQLLNASFIKGGELKPLQLKDVLTIYNKAIQLENIKAVEQVKRLCSQGPKNTMPGSNKYRRVNTVM